MPSISSFRRAALVAVVIVASAIAGIASAPAKTTRGQAKLSHSSTRAEKPGSAKNHRDAAKNHRHAAKNHRRRRRHAKRRHAKRHHAKRHHAGRHRAAKRIKTSAARKNAPTRPTATAATATTPTTTATSTILEPTGITGSWNLALDSEFDGASLNTSVWQTGWFNSTGTSGPINSSETACYSPSNVSFPGDGAMHLNVTHTASTCGGAKEPWTGAVVTTNPNDGRGSGGFQYTYGVVEARVYVPADGNGIANWPAVWSDGQSWPNDGEDDVMESINNKVCSTFHDPLGAPHVCLKTGAVTPGWHTFASDWEPGSVTYYYDGQNVGSVTTGVTSSPMYLVLDNTVDATDFSNNVADSMQVQYVRVWQHS